MGKRHQFLATLAVGYGEVEVSAAAASSTGKFTGEDANNRRRHQRLD